MKIRITDAFAIGFATMLLFASIRPAISTQCTCRNDIPADSSGRGTCTKTQNGKLSCRLEWNSGGTQEQNAQIGEFLKSQGIKLRNIDAPGEDEFERSAAVLSDPTKQPAAAAPAVANLIVGALARGGEKDRLPIFDAFLKRYDSKDFEPFYSSSGLITHDKLLAGDKTYSVRIERGCVGLWDTENFSIIVKTEFAQQKEDCSDAR